jgi:NNP family nitrate/nitrite transporter-like MFS transporter
MSRWIVDWNPEDEAFWNRTGRRVARRNLVWSVLAEHLGFSVWMMWSVTATRLRDAGFHYTTDELFALIAIPGLVGALMRFPYTFAVPRFGGRNWTIVSALLLLVPIAALATLVTRPETPFWMMAAAAGTAGLGGGNFASSMANISFFYPDREKGFALGLNAAGGNIGVSSVQLVVPFVIGLSPFIGSAAPGAPALVNAGLVWLPFVVIAAIGAFLFMDNLASAKSSLGAQLAIVRRKHTWVISWLYIGTFGSFVGYSAAFPLLLKTQFPGASVRIAFVGALVGSLARPVGGRLADKLGGARVTFWNFVVMAAAALGVVLSLHAKSYFAFVTMFFALFVTTGIGNGSTYRMVPAVFRAENLRDAKGRGPEAEAAALESARWQTAAVLGVTSAIGAIGGYLVPRAFGASIRATGSAEDALWIFVGFYVTSIALTWWCYLRTTILVSRIPSLAEVKA